ncbi:MAG: hypothetical protein H0U76_21755 [Ktedonobacteraceae bacterium]|nr:hypothetical protein [Ktedonobacteraceae bacterium]
MPGPLRHRPNGNDGVNADPGIYAGNLDRSIARAAQIEHVFAIPAIASAPQAHCLLHG